MPEYLVVYCRRRLNDGTAGVGTGRIEVAPGVVGPPESAEMMAEGLRGLADDAALRERLGRAGRGVSRRSIWIRSGC